MNTKNTFQYGNEVGGEQEERRSGPASPSLNTPSAFADSLWSRLVEFQFDAPGTTYHFATRLAQENGWSPAFTERVLAEYRRFLFLALRAGHPVSPSDAVDQAWHLHLLYTESYWGDLCPRVLGESFHHGPSKGGTAEDRKFTDWYARTLESYARLFGQQPPGDIWPPIALRFRGKKRYHRVCLNDAWVIPKFRLRRRGAIFAAAGRAFLPLIAEETDTVDPAVVCIVIVALCFALVIVFLAMKVALRGGARRSSDSSCGGAGYSDGGGGDNGHHGGHGHGGHGGHDGGGSGHSCGGGHGCGGGGHGCGGGSSCGGGSCGGGGCGGGH